jgi:hypothetical protein
LRDSLSGRAYEYQRYCPKAGAKSVHEGDITMRRKSHLLLFLLLLTVPLSLRADTVTLYTDQAAWIAATNGTTATNLPAYFAANNIPAGYLTGPQTFGGVTFNSQQVLCQYPGRVFNQMYVDDGSSISPAGLYPIISNPESSCYEYGQAFISLPGQGATAFAFTIQSWPGNNPPAALAFPGGISLFTGVGTDIGDFSGLNISQPTFLGFTSTEPINFLEVGLPAICVNCFTQELLITDVAFGSAGAATGTVPEPSSLLLLGSGLLSLVGVSRRKFGG